jgi:acetyl-CoA synthetase
MDFWQAAAFDLDGLPGGNGLNIAYEVVDRHLRRGAGDREAFRFIDRKGQIATWTYADLARASNRFANVLTGLGIERGDAVFALLDRTPELYIAAIGALKAGCLFSVLFTSFGPEPIRLRLIKGKARLLVAGDSLYQRKVADGRALMPDLRHVLTVGALAPGTQSFAQLLDEADADYTIPPTDPEQPALLHFTSGTTGTPKAAVHVHRAVIAHHLTARIALGLAAGDVYWCTADAGWVTGVSYGLIAPLTVGVTAIVDQGEFEAERWYRILAGQNVTVWYTAPTAIRMLMRAGTDLARRFDLSNLRVVASVGEPLNPEAVRWGRDALGIPIHDTWWQTETGAIMIANLPGRDVVPGAMGRPLPGITAEIVRRGAAGGVEILTEAEADGELALRPGWPSMFRAYLEEPERYGRCFADGLYLTGDLARRDADGVFWFVGRADEVIKSAGHLIGPFEVESCLIEHPAVAEAGVIGKPDPVIGESVKAFVALKPGVTGSDSLRRELLGHARRRLGPSLAPREIAFCPDLPRTRSGKIMRRVLKARELGLPEGDVSSLESADDGG